MDLGGQRLGRGVDAAYRLGQLVRPLAVRADHELAAELARPLDVDDDQPAMLPASSRAQRCSVTASLNVLLSRSSLVTAVTMSIRLTLLTRGDDPPEPPALGGAARPPEPPGPPSGGIAAPTVTTSNGTPCLSRLAVRVADTGPFGPSSVQSACLAVPMETPAGSAGGERWDGGPRLANPTGGDVASWHKDPPGRNRPGGPVP